MGSNNFLVSEDMKILTNKLSKIKLCVSGQTCHPQRYVLCTRKRWGWIPYVRLGVAPKDIANKFGAKKTLLVYHCCEE